MLTGDDGLPLARPPAGYPLSFPDDGILVDDPGHPRDLTAAVRAVFDVVFGSRADAMWQEVAALLDPRDHDLRRWLASGFFEHHLRRHSKSRRKAPILWQLGIPSGRYSVWCYAHRMTRDSLFAIQNDIVGPKLATEERRLSSLVTQAGQTPSARERAEIAAQQALVDELRTLADEVRRVAPLWNPDLDDGIVLVMAPFWRLVPTHKAWQKELRTKWDELVAGKYDWAHLAMHLWPERVVPKCATDRSLAIAHGLEDVFWVEANDGKWAARKTPTRPIAELIAERTRRRFKAALTSLLEAPATRCRETRQEFSTDFLMHPLHDDIARLLADRLKARSVVVWYDPRAEFVPFVDELRGAPANGAAITPVIIAGGQASLIQFAGSMFEIRALIEPLVSREVPDRVVVYLPGCEPDAIGSVLMEIEKAGVRWELQLKRVARDVLRKRYTDGVIDGLLAPQGVTYKDLAIASSDTGSAEQPSLLKTIFHDASGSDAIVAAWLAEGGRDADIEAKQAQLELSKLIRSRLGLELPEATSLAKMRAITLRYVLGGEFRSDLTGAPPGSLDGIPVPRTKENETAIRDMAQRLRTSFADAYPNWPTALKASSTFPPPQSLPRP